MKVLSPLTLRANLSVWNNTVPTLVHIFKTNKTSKNKYYFKWGCKIFTFLNKPLFKDLSLVFQKTKGTSVFSNNTYSLKYETRKVCRNFTSMCLYCVSIWSHWSASLQVLGPEVKITGMVLLAAELNMTITIFFLDTRSLLMQCKMCQTLSYHSFHFSFFTSIKFCHLRKKRIPA